MFQKFLKQNKDSFYLVFRLLVGFMFMLHGAQKLGILEGSFSFPSSGLMILASIIEFVGGILIVLGAFTEVAAFFGGITMIWAYISVHAGNGWNPLVNKGELALLYLAAFLVLMTLGPGKKWVLRR